jgi:hypothetical protein
MMHAEPTLRRPVASATDATRDLDIPMTTVRQALNRLAVIAVAGAATWDQLEVDANLPIDRGAMTPRLAAAVLGRGLAAALAEMSALDATCLMTSWALSADRLRRLAVLEALAHVMPLGARSALVHLAFDADRTVRASARRRLGTEPGRGHRT